MTEFRHRREEMKDRLIAWQNALELPRWQQGTRGVGMTARTVGRRLAEFQLRGRGDAPWPSAAYVGELLDCSERTVRRAWDELEGQGWLVGTRRRGATTVWAFVLPALDSVGGIRAKFLSPELSTTADIRDESAVILSDNPVPPPYTRVGTTPMVSRGHGR